MSTDSAASAPYAPASAAPTAFRWTEEMLRTVLDQAPFLTGILSLEGRVLTAGRNALAARGYALEDMLGRIFWEVPSWRGSAEIRERLKAGFHAALRGEVFHALLPFQRADGTERWTDLSLSPIRDAAGEVAQVIALGHDVTPRIRAERELATVRRRLESALLAAELGTYEWDVTADVVHADPNLARMFGLELGSDGSAPLATFVAALHPDDQARVQQRIRHSVENAVDFEEDYRLTVRGELRWVNARGRMIQDGSGRVTSFVGVVMDITRRKLAEQESQTMAERLRRLSAIHESLLSGINDFAYVFDLQGRFIYANRPLLALYGRSLEDVVGKTFSELGYPAWHAEMHLREIAQVIATRKPFQGEIFFRGESGNSGVFDYIFVPVFGADGQVEAVAGTTRDVTAHRRGEARDRLLVALDDAIRPLTDPAAITHTGARLLGEHLAVNRCAYADVEEDENTFNLTGDFNREVPSIVGRYRFDQFGEECLRLMREGKPYVVTDAETDLRTAAVRDAYRATLIRSVICVPLHKSGRFVAAMAVHQKTPREWQPSDIDLVFAVANRSWESIERARVVRELAASERRLTQAVTELGRASRAKDDFLAALSHELRTPLNPVLLLASESAADPSLSEEVRESFAAIRKNVELEARLIDDLLDLTAIVRGKLTAKKSVIDLHAVLADAVAAVQPDFDAKEMALTVSFGSRKPLVYADEVRLAQVFINLLKNAVKFTPRGGKVMLQTTTEGGMISVSLLDSGIGMTAAELERVFDAFEQGDHAGDGSTHRFGGLGLGLAISRRLVEFHGGQLTAMSEGRDRGATFTVRLPLSNGSDEALPNPSVTPAAAAAAVDRPRQILLIEDHEATRQALAKLLQRRGYQVRSAGSVSEARTEAAQVKFDLVLSDVGLPDGDGAALMTELRDAYGLKGIALTGYGMDEDIERCRMAGFTTHLTKPVRVEALDAALRQTLG